MNCHSALRPFVFFFFFFFFLIRLTGQETAAGFLREEANRSLPIFNKPNSFMNASYRTWCVVCMGRVGRNSSPCLPRFEIYGTELTSGYLLLVCRQHMIRRIYHNVYGLAL
ncbi:hypothetical protein F5Y06DRAFT_273611, partial [Hypoxylon sp. FL0890]